MTEKLNKEFTEWRDAEIDENWSHIPSLKYKQKITHLMGAAYRKGRDDSKAEIERLKVENKIIEIELFELKSRDCKIVVGDSR